MRLFNEDKTWDDKQKKKYILDDRGERIYDPKNTNTSATKSKPPTGASRLKSYSVIEIFQIPENTIQNGVVNSLVAS